MAGKEGAALAQQTLLAEAQTALAVPQADAWILMIERLATNPDVNVDKLERLLAMQERVLARGAEAEFNAAFSEMQPEIPVIIREHDGDGGKWSFAPLEDIVEPLRPILSKHGFSLAHQTEWPDPRTVKVIGILTHRGGHSRKSEFVAAADNTGSKNGIQALGSSVSYGKRYTTKDLLCIVTRGEDDDGATSEKGKLPPVPEGYEAWFATLEGVALEGLAAFSNAWNKSQPQFRDYISKHTPKELARIRNKANKATNGGQR